MNEMYYKYINCTVNCTNNKQIKSIIYYLVKNVFSVFFLLILGAVPDRCHEFDLSK